MGKGRLRGRVEQRLWPLVETFIGSHDVAGLAVALVRDDEVVGRGFGVRDVGTGAPVTPETMFHLASVSKPFVATAVVSLARAGVLDLHAAVTDWVPELTLSDGRQGEVTAHGLLSHTSGLPDVADYGWHDPRHGDEALSRFAESLSDWRLQADPGTTFSYSNAGYELLGLLLSRATGTTFEDAVREHVLIPSGMPTSTFLRTEVPQHLAASPHVGMPISVPRGSYPYTRSHAPSSSLHSNLVELGHWMTAHLEPTGPASDLRDEMWQPVVAIGRSPWEEAMAQGWSVGRYRGHRMLSHGGLDPGFVARLALLPEERTGVAVLANSNTVPASVVARAALDIVLADDPTTGEGVMEMASLRRPVAGPVADALAGGGADGAMQAYRRLASLQPPEYDLDDEGFVDAVWGAIELHRTDVVWPLVRLWHHLRPDSSTAWTMTGWAHEVDGELDQARAALQRALDLDIGNEEAAQMMGRLAPA